MNKEKFIHLAKEYNIVPVYEKVTADILTPVLVYSKIRAKSKNSFLLESVEGIGALARYSFIGKDPHKIFYNSGNKITIKENDKTTEVNENLFDYLSEEIKNYKFPRIDELPDFTGGIMGYLGFENISLIEDVIEFTNEDILNNPDSIFGIYKTIIAFDHYKHQMILINNVEINNSTNLDEEYDKAKQKIKKLKNLIIESPSEIGDFSKTINENESDKNDFLKIIEKCKHNIYNGDVFQLVISKRFNADYEGDLLNVYRALRIINPSPYMYYMDFDNGFKVIGTSPEDLLKVKDRRTTILPIAGTRPRGKDNQEDLELEKDLLADPKEIAEHVMLVDLARNDLGRICDYNSVEVTEDKRIHRFSHVMHIVSRVEGNLSEGKDCIDALKASYPAGTVSGAPKIRAIQLINEYESIRRNLYAGAVGYIDFSGNLDMCIAIRTLFAKNKKVYWQAGAGIVADSNPETEYQEIKNKSAVLVNALNYAEEIDEDSSN